MEVTAAWLCPPQGTLPTAEVLTRAAAPGTALGGSRTWACSLLTGPCRRRAGGGGRGRGWQSGARSWPSWSQNYFLQPQWGPDTGNVTRFPGRRTAGALEADGVAVSCRAGLVRREEVCGAENDDRGDSEHHGDTLETKDGTARGNLERSRDASHVPAGGALLGGPRGSCRWPRAEAENPPAPLRSAPRPAGAEDAALAFRRRRLSCRWSVLHFASCSRARLCVLSLGRGVRTAPRVPTAFCGARPAVPDVRVPGSSFPTRRRRRGRTGHGFGPSPIKRASRQLFSAWEGFLQKTLKTGVSRTSAVGNNGRPCRWRCI